MIATQEHRGHPTHGEEYRARHTAERIGAALVVLCDQEGLSHDEAVGFIAGMAWETGLLRRDTWASPKAAIDTVANLLAGRAAKHWSMDILDITLNELAEVL